MKHEKCKGCICHFRGRKQRRSKKMLRLKQEILQKVMCAIIPAIWKQERTPSESARLTWRIRRNPPVDTLIEEGKAYTRKWAMNEWLAAYHFFDKRSSPNLYFMCMNCRWKVTNKSVLLIVIKIIANGLSVQFTSPLPSRSKFRMNLPTFCAPKPSFPDIACTCSTKGRRIRIRRKL